MYARPCHCIGHPLRIEPDSCFTCGRFLPGVAGEVEPASDRPGYGALLEAVHRTRRKMRPAAPRHNHRRVVIEPPSRALQTVRGALSVC